MIALELTPNMFGVSLFRIITRIFLFRSEYHSCERKSDVESPGEYIPLFPATDLNKMPMVTNKEGTSMHYENPDGSF